MLQKQKQFFSVYVVVNGILIIRSNSKGFFEDNDELNQFGEILDAFFFFFMFSENPAVTESP